MIQSIFSAARIQGVAVGQKRHAALFLTEICYRFCVVWTKEGEVSKFTEMHFDRDEFSVHVNIFDSCSNAELLQLVQLAGSNRTPEIGKINR